MSLRIVNVHASFDKSENVQNLQHIGANPEHVPICQYLSRSATGLPLPHFALSGFVGGTFLRKVDPRGVEPLTSSLQTRRSSQLRLRALRLQKVQNRQTRKNLLVTLAFG